MSNQPSNGFRVSWYRTPLPRGRLKELNQRSDFKGLMQAGGHLGLMVISGLGCIYARQELAWGWLVPFLLFHGMVCSFCVNAMHELSHGTVFKTKWLNTFFITAFSFVGWHNHVFFNASHTRHHQNTLHFPHDSEVVLPQRVILLDFFHSFFRPLGFFYTIKMHVRYAMGRYTTDWERFLMADQKLSRAVSNWSGILLAGHLAITVVSLFFGWWILPLVVSCTPLYGGTLFLLLNSTQHIGLKDNVDDFRLILPVH